jgi:hypothetical protein
MGLMKEISQQIQELGMIKSNNDYYVEWSDDDKDCHIVVTRDHGVFWTVDTGDKWWEGSPQTPFEAIEEINICISDQALGATIGNEDQE